jgi:hypothetical protein
MVRFGRVNARLVSARRSECMVICSSVSDLAADVYNLAIDGSHSRSVYQAVDKGGVGFLKDLPRVTRSIDGLSRTMPAAVAGASWAEATSVVPESTIRLPMQYRCILNRQPSEVGSCRSGRNADLDSRSL